MPTDQGWADTLQLHQPSRAHPQVYYLAKNHTVLSAHISSHRCQLRACSWWRILCHPSGCCCIARTPSHLYIDKPTAWPLPSLPSRTTPLLFPGASRTSSPLHVADTEQTAHLDKMRASLAPVLLAPLGALAAPDILADFEPAVAGLQDNIYDSMPTPQPDLSPELVKRQGNGCANNYFNCAGLGAPGLCCPRTAVCSADQAGHVACCPQGAACTGALGRPTGNPTATATVPFVTATTTANGPFVQQTNGANHGSTVQNQFYPFPYIPTTYKDAAACSSAYTSCQSDAASCTSALANGAAGVTISAPNGGATITAIPSVGLSSAQSICSSLSSLGCSQLTVEACQAFDGTRNAAWRAPCRDYIMTAGVALGIAGQLLA